MRISTTQLKQIIKEELEAMAEGGDVGHRGNPNKPWDALFPPGSGGGKSGSAQEQALALKDLMGALRAMGTNVTASNLETIQGLLDHLKSVVGDSDVPLGADPLDVPGGGAPMESPGWGE